MITWDEVQAFKEMQNRLYEDIKIILLRRNDSYRDVTFRVEEEYLIISYYSMNERKNYDAIYTHNGTAIQGRVDIYLRIYNKLKKEALRYLGSNYNIKSLIIYGDSMEVTNGKLGDSYTFYLPELLEPINQKIKGWPLS